MENLVKPKLIFFQGKLDGVATFLEVHKLAQVKCLSHFFEVIVISDPCDYQQVCDSYQPDITLFESGIVAGENDSCRRVINTDVYPEIPKIGFYNGDPFCGWRSTFLSEMDHWGLKTIFSLSVPLAEYIPEITENLFFWPNSIDDELYRDYNQPKIIPVLFTGSHSSLYPWRKRIQKLVSQYYPSLICPHLGYLKSSTSRMMYGEQYARTINASWFVPACGTMANEVVRKHFEIPGCKACLITERTLGLESAGFIDMENCVFADEDDVLEKIDYLLENPEKLESIIDAGYNLVHSQHTFKQRDQILQWFNLNKILKPNQRIVQENPFGSLSILKESTEVQNSSITIYGLDRILLRQGDQKLREGQYDEAEVSYLSCLDYYPYIPEPKLRLAICNLYKGNSKEALHWIVQPIRFSLFSCKGVDPDPVEWAYFIIALICQGRLNQAVILANQFPHLRHPELDRTRWLVNVITHSGYAIPIPAIPIPDGDAFKYRISVQQLPLQSKNDWIRNIHQMLQACQQFSFAEDLINAGSPDSQILQRTNKTPQSQLKFWIQSSINKVIAIPRKQLSDNLDKLLNVHPAIRGRLYDLSINENPIHITLINRIIFKIKGMNPWASPSN